MSEQVYRTISEEIATLRHDIKVKTARIEQLQTESKRTYDRWTYLSIAKLIEERLCPQYQRDLCEETNSCAIAPDDEGRSCFNHCHMVTEIVVEK